jgi:hypothetical protein
MLRLSYRATYRATQKRAPHRATWIVARVRGALRIDVTTGHQTATLVVNGRGSFSCAAAGRRRTCFRVARAGKPIPAPFNHAPQLLFSTDLSDLAARAGDYAITTTDVTTAGGRPGDACFRIRALASAPKPQAPTGSYCFTSKGVLDAVLFPTGSALRLVSFTSRSPKPAFFRPYSSPTPLPG